MTAKSIHTGPGEGAAYSGVGDVYRVLVNGEQTGGVYTLAEVRVSPDNGPPPHIHHREDEGFFILEGEVTFQLGDHTVQCTAGSFIQGPRGIPHAFTNTAKTPARLLVCVTPPGFENFRKEFATPLPSFASPAQPVTPRDIEKLPAVAPRFGPGILPPPKLSFQEFSS
jgi:quercetin dioxygenase-like cupin family protein